MQGVSIQRSAVLPGETWQLGIVLVPATLAIWRAPAARALLPALPSLAMLAGVWLRLALLPDPVVIPADVELRVVDLAGRPPPHGLAASQPTVCAQLPSGERVGRCEGALLPVPRQVAPDTPLSAAPPGPWLATWPTPFRPLRLRHLELNVSGQGWKLQHTLRAREVDGGAVLELDGSPLGAAPAPLDAALHERIGEALGEAGVSAVQVEVERSAAWTVQDMVSICASAAQQSSRLVDCTFAP